MIKNISKFAAVALLVTLMGTASARVNLGFSFGTCCPQPAFYPMYAPAPVVYHRPCAPTFGFGIGGPNFGFNFDIPLSPRPVEVVRHMKVINTSKLDNQNKAYWRFFNRTNFDVTIMNAHGRVTVAPGESETLSRCDSFKFKVSVAGDRFPGRSSCHNVIIKYDKHMDEFFYTEQ